MFRWPISVLVMFATMNIVRAQPTTLPPPAHEGSLVRLARRIEPDLHGKSERLTQYVEFFQSQVGNDRRLFAFDVNVTQADEGRVRLDGYVELPETRTGLDAFLKVLGFADIENRIETLPAASLGDKIFGLVKVTHTLSYDSPHRRHDVVTDCLLGEPLYLLRKEGDYLLVHSAEGYLGYVAAKDVHRVAATGFDSYTTAPTVRMISDHTTDNGLVLPTGAVLKRVGNEDAHISCEVPTGETMEVPADKCQPTSLPSEKIDQAIACGRQLLGTPYHWGGKTADGIDCSGLVQLSFATVGLHLPRDSNQQFYLGQLTATRWHRSRMQRGDTLYFVGADGRIRHTAIYLGDDQFLQAEMPKVTVSSFNPDDENYKPARDKSFVFAKRLW